MNFPLYHLPMNDAHVNAACLDFLVQELVPTAVRVSSRLLETSGRDSEPDLATRMDVQLSLIPNDFPGTVAAVNSQLVNSDDVTLRIENCGYNLGIRLADLLAYKSFSGPSSGKVVDILDIMKFVCRDVWKALYGKQMDNLRTNHRGTFVLVDNGHRMIAHLSSTKGTADTLAKAHTYLWYPCGVIRGILYSFGVESGVSAEISQFPAVTFNIQTSINN
jgi:hypothetical protein